MRIDQAAPFEVCQRTTDGLHRHGKKERRHAVERVQIALKFQTCSGAQLSISKAFSKAYAMYGVAVEIKANPWRLDQDWRWLGCVMSINPDAHSTREIDVIHWGVEMARKGGVPTRRVLKPHASTADAAPADTQIAWPRDG